MSWRVIFTGTAAFVLAIVVGALALLLREEHPGLSALTVVAEFSVIVGGLKTVLETTKTANELRRMGFEIEKLQLEITEKKKIAEQAGSRITVATLSEIETYSVRVAPVRNYQTRGMTIIICLIGVSLGAGYIVTGRVSKQVEESSLPAASSAESSPSAASSAVGTAEPSLSIKADLEGAINGCKDGDLLLDESGLHFTCPSDSTRNMVLSILDIKQIDKSGVEAASGQKYHFNIQSVDRQQGEGIFRAWFNQARRKASPPF